MPHAPPSGRPLPSSSSSPSPSPPLPPPSLPLRGVAPRALPAALLPTPRPCPGLCTGPWPRADPATEPVAVVRDPATPYAYAYSDADAVAADSRPFHQSPRSVAANGCRGRRNAVRKSEFRSLRECECECQCQWRAACGDEVGGQRTSGNELHTDMLSSRLSSRRLQQRRTSATRHQQRFVCFHAAYLVAQERDPADP